MTLYPGLFIEDGFWGPRRGFDTMIGGFFGLNVGGGRLGRCGTG